MKKRMFVFIILAALLLTWAGADLAPDGDELDLGAGEADEAVFADAEETAATAEDINIAAPYAILMEKETGEVIYEKDADTKTSPASVTKVMSLLLIVENIESGSLSLDESVTASAHAAGMGGSQVYLEEGEQMSVREMLKCIVVSSANDATVAMAEHIAGTEQAFVALMNQRAEELGMTNTKFCNCTGLSDDEEHLTTARDIAIMSRELIRHDMIKEYTSIWMDTIRDGEFGLSNTNKLIYYYDGATGLKTGFTRRAMYCLSATAERDGVEYIAVVLHCETSPDRFESAKILLNYAFANYTLADTADGEESFEIPVRLGRQDAVGAAPESCEKMLVKKNEASSLEYKTELEEFLTAPVEKGQQVGTLTVYKDGTPVKSIAVIAKENVERLSVMNIFTGFLGMMFAGNCER